MSDDGVVLVEISEALDGQRIDRVISLLLEISRAAANDLLEQRRIEVDGAIVTKPSLKLTRGQRLAIPSEVQPSAVDADPSVHLDLVFVDNDVVVVDKPAGLVVHPGAGVSTGTLVQGLLARYPDLGGVGERGRPGIVHRLDKGTSGLLMIARSQLAYEHLTDQLRNRSVGRHYWALVHGEPQSREGVIDAPIGRSLRHPTRQTVRADGKAARTSYEVLERFDEDIAGAPLTLVQFVLETGRTHQIRVHADAIDLPLVGDDRYGRIPVPEVLQPLHRPLLHARRLAFHHPGGEWMEFTSEVPADFRTALRRLGSTVVDG